MNSITLEKRREVVQNVIDRLIQCDGYLIELELLNSQYEIKDQRIRSLVKVSNWINLEDEGIEVNCQRMVLYEGGDY